MALASSMVSVVLVRTVSGGSSTDGTSAAVASSPYRESPGGEVR